MFESGGRIGEPSARDIAARGWSVAAHRLGPGPIRRRGFNQGEPRASKSKQNQAKGLGFAWFNWDFSKCYGQKNKKNFAPPPLASRVARRKPKRAIRPALTFTAAAGPPDEGASEGVMTGLLPVIHVFDTWKRRQSARQGQE